MKKKKIWRLACLAAVTAALLWGLTGCSPRPEAEACIAEGEKLFSQAASISGRLEYEFSYSAGAADSIQPDMEATDGKQVSPPKTVGSETEASTTDGNETAAPEAAARWETTATLTIETSGENSCAFVTGQAAVQAGALSFQQQETRYYVMEGEDAFAYVSQEQGWSRTQARAGATRLVHQESFLDYLKDESLSFTVDAAVCEEQKVWQVSALLSGEQAGHMLYSAGCLLEDCTGQALSFSSAAQAKGSFCFAQESHRLVKAEFLFSESIQPEITGEGAAAESRLTLYFDSWEDSGVSVPAQIRQEGLKNGGIAGLEQELHAQAAGEEGDNPAASVRAEYPLTAADGTVLAGVNTPAGLQMSYESLTFMEFDNDLYGKLSYQIVEGMTEEELMEDQRLQKLQNPDFEKMQIAGPKTITAGGLQASYLRMDYGFVETMVQEYCIWIELRPDSAGSPAYLVCKILDLSVEGEPFAYEETEIVQKAVAAVRLPQ